MTGSPVVDVRDGGGAWSSGTTGGVDVTPGNTISIRLHDSSGVSVWALQIFGVDEVTATPPTLTGVHPVTHIVTSPSTIVTFTMPAGAGIGRSLIFRSIVNSATQTTFGIYVLTSLGKRVGAVGEKFEGDPNFGWAAILNPLIRSGSGGGLPPLAGEQYAALLEDPVGNLVFERINQDMILPGFSIASFSPTGAGYSSIKRRGDTISSVTATVSYIAGPPNSGTIGNTLDGSTGGGDVNPGSWAFSTPFASGTMTGSVKRDGVDLGADPTWSINLSVTKGAVTKNSSVTVTWTSNVLTGVGAAGLNTQGALEGALTSTLTTARAQTFTVSPSTQKVYYCYPKGRGTSTFTLNGFPAAFNAPIEVSFTNTNGLVETYYVYESTNLLTGSGLNFVVS
jgi:hypothetical protein